MELLDRIKEDSHWGYFCYTFSDRCIFGKFEDGSVGTADGYCSGDWLRMLAHHEDNI